MADRIGVDMFNSPDKFATGLRKIVSTVRSIYRSICPVDFAVLQSGIKARLIVQKDNTYSIEVTAGENVDYFGATNGPWINRSGQNPNEGWFELADVLASTYIDLFLRGMDEEVDILLEEQGIKEDFEELEVEDIEVIWE